jgi:hypothetical protein
MQSISSPVHLPAQPLSPPLLDQLKAILGPRHLLTGEAEVRPFAQGIRFGSGPFWPWRNQAAWWNNGACCAPVWRRGSS